MIWIFAMGLCVVVFTYITIPLYVKNPLQEETPDTQKNETIVYRNELKAIEKIVTSGDESPAALAVQKSILEKRLITSATQRPHLSSRLKTGWIVGTFAVLVSGTFGTYILIGSPKLTSVQALKTPVLSAPQALSQNGPDVQHENNASMEDLIAGLEKKLQAGGQSPQQWGLYARSLMTVNRFEDAISAYEKTLLLSNNNPDIKAEVDSARAFIAQQNSGKMTQPGPSREEVEAAQSMPPQDRAAMIQGMVMAYQKS